MNAKTRLFKKKITFRQGKTDCKILKLANPGFIMAVGPLFKGMGTSVRAGNTWLFEVKEEKWSNS